MEWMVVYRIATQNGGWGFAEFYRGSEETCRRIQDNFAGGECDLIPTKPWKVAIGTVASWSAFLQELDYEQGNGAQNDAGSNRSQRRA